MSRSNLIELDVLLELKDYLRVNYWFFFIRNRLIYLAAFFGLIIYPLIVYSAIASGKLLQHWGVLVVPLVFCFLMWSIYSGSKRQMASSQAMQQRTHYSFSLEGVDAVAQTFTTHHDWSNFREAVELKHSFLLFTSRNQMYLIPKRCFGGMEQMEQFRAMLRAHLSSNAKLKKS